MKRLFPLLLLALAAACDDSTGSTENLQVGDVLSLNVNANNVCENPINRQARVVAVSEHTAVLADVTNPSNGFTDAEYQEFATEFERVSWPVVTRTFGAPSDVDNNGCILMVFTSAVNELTPRNADYIVGGFFFARDLFPKKDTDEAGACASSNVREMFYLLAPDPGGSVNGNARTKAYVRNSTFGTLSHEFQHLVNASRRLYTNGAADFEDTWLDEGLSHIAEELSFYDASGLGPKQNIAITTQFFTNSRLDVLNRYQAANLGRLNEYYAAPSANSPIQDDDDLATRGSAWQFLRYGADQKASDERTVWFNLANSTTTGIANLTTVLGGDPIPLLQNWGVSIYTDDGVTGVPSTFTQPSWNYRQALSNEGLGGFRLDVDTLTNGATRRIELAAAGNAYLRLGVAAGGRADVRTVGPGVSGSAACSVAPLTAVGQVYQPASATSAAICLEGGAAGAEYVVIPFFASTSDSETALVSVTATGVTRPTGGPNPSLSPLGPTLARAAAGPEADGDGGFETELRTRERRALGSLFTRGAARSTAAAARASEVRVSIVRTR